MVYTSDDDFSDELPDIQLLLEQRLAKGAGAALDTAAELPPSLFDPITPPKPKPKPKPTPKPKPQSTRLEPKSKPGTVKKHKGAVETPGNSIPQVPKEVEAKKVTVTKKQIKKATTEETIITGKTVSGAGRKPRGGHVEVPSLTETASEASDYASAAENVIEREEPAPRRRRLIQKKYLPSSEDDDDDDEGEKDKKQETVKKPQRQFIDLTGSEEEEGSPQTLVSQVASTISEDDDNGFTLKYSPPRSSKPRKTIAPVALTKGPVTGRKLGSPTKKAPKIPPSQHRKSSDAFWDQGATNTWIDAHTPHKTPSGGLWGRGVTEEVEEEEEDDNDMFEGEEGGDISEEGEDEEETRPTTKHTTSKANPKGPKENTESKRAFNARKKQLAEDFFKLIDDKIGGGEVARKTAATGGVKIIWSKTLRTTAGTAKWRAEKLQNISAQAALEHPMSTERAKHHATIELAEKVVDSQEKLYNTMCHEYCHMANYMISYVQKPAHGAEFKRWAAKCSREFGHLGVIVTTKHSYEIDAKFKWTCQTPGCGQVYKRHSKSIDITRSRCGVCKVGTLLQTHPPLKEKRPITGYQSFMKENFGRIKAENPGVPQRDIMKIVAQAYRGSKATELEEVGKGFVETGEKEGGLETMLGGLKV